MRTLLGQRIRFPLMWMGVIGLISVGAFSTGWAQCPIQLVDVTRRTGVTFVHTHGGGGNRYIIESVSAGLALLDYDGDGDEDIYFLNGSPLFGTETTETPRNALYRNDDNWRFTDVTQHANVGDTGFGLGVCAGDYDNDGDLDLYLNNYGPNVLYHNNGDGTFTDVTKTAGVGNGHRVGAGANFLDIDRDGDLDLFVSNYLKFSFDTHVPRSWRGVPMYPGPKDHPAETNTLYRNHGDGTFTDISEPSGIAAHAGWGMGTVCYDYDNDGDIDIYVANDVSANSLFRNDGTGRFEEVGLSSGAALDIAGREQGSMGASCGDYDRDGWLDLYVTSYQAEFATLYRGAASGFFDDVTLPARAGSATLRHVTWGNSFVDFDNDGDLDLFIACGHVQDNIQQYDDTSSYRARNVVLMNTGDGRFVNVSDQCGDGLNVELVSRGAAFDDLDHDGDIDVVVLNSQGPPTILKNESTGGNHWLQVLLQGTKSSRDGVGSRIKVVAGNLTQIAEVHSGRGYQSHFGMRCHFGLGRSERIDRIEVRWLSGHVDVLENVRVDQRLTITERSASARTGSDKQK